MDALGPPAVIAAEKSLPRLIGCDPVDEARQCFRHLRQRIVLGVALVLLASAMAGIAILNIEIAGVDMTSQPETLPLDRRLARVVVLADIICGFLAVGWGMWALLNCTSKIREFHWYPNFGSEYPSLLNYLGTTPDRVSQDERDLRDGAFESLTLMAGEMLDAQFELKQKLLDDKVTGKDYDYERQRIKDRFGYAFGTFSQFGLTENTWNPYFQAIKNRRAMQEEVCAEV